MYFTKNLSATLWNKTWSSSQCVTQVNVIIISSAYDNTMCSLRTSRYPTDPWSDRHESNNAAYEIRTSRMNCIKAACLSCQPPSTNGDTRYMTKDFPDRQRGAIRIASSYHQNTNTHGSCNRLPASRPIGPSLPDVLLPMVGWGGSNLCSLA